MGRFPSKKRNGSRRVLIYEETIRNSEDEYHSWKMSDWFEIL